MPGALTTSQFESPIACPLCSHAHLSRRSMPRVFSTDASQHKLSERKLVKLPSMLSALGLHRTAVGTSSCPDSRCGRSPHRLAVTIGREMAPRSSGNDSRNFPVSAWSLKSRARFRGARRQSPLQYIANDGPSSTGPVPACERCLAAWANGGRASVDSCALK